MELLKESVQVVSVRMPGTTMYNTRDAKMRSGIQVLPETQFVLATCKDKA